MAAVTLEKMVLTSPNPAPFAGNYQWKATVNCAQMMQEDIDVTVYWVTAPAAGDGEPQVQTLEELSVGPLQKGLNAFPIEHAAPKFEQMPGYKLMFLHAIYVVLSYKEQEFLRVSFPVHVAPAPSVQACGGQPMQITIHSVQRQVIEVPQVKLSHIAWDECGEASMSGMLSVSGMPEGSRTGFEGSRAGGQSGDAMAVDDEAPSHPNPAFNFPCPAVMAP
eukprot:Hpha_TRINITY_DN16125_c3_g5::TRINITY_DN16125_c3_g5_i1::g.7008::m.7008/K10753/ASF1; histone chaperone ASF1